MTVPLDVEAARVAHTRMPCVIAPHRSVACAADGAHLHVGLLNMAALVEGVLLAIVVVVPHVTVVLVVVVV